MIRTAGEKDIERIRTVVQRSWMETYADSLGADTVRDHVTDEEFYTPTELRNRLRDTDGVVLVAETDEAGIVGYTYLSWNSNAGYIDEHEADLRHIYLHPDHYGRGLGSRLLEAGISRLPEGTRHLKVLFHPENNGARGFYEANGFAQVGLLDLDPSEVGMPSSNVNPPEMYVRDL